MPEAARGLATAFNMRLWQKATIYTADVFSKWITAFSSTACICVIIVHRMSIQANRQLALKIEPLYLTQTPTVTMYLRQQN